MAKRGVAKITGPKNPKVGEPATYSIAEWYPDTPSNQRNGANVTWELFRKRSNGNYTSTNNKKKGTTGTFTFSEKALGHEFFVEGYLNSPEKKGNTIVHIKPVKGSPKIVSLTLFDSNRKRITTKPKYGQTLVAEVKTQNMFNEKVLLQIWERDTTSNTGHDKDENTLLYEKQITINADGLNYENIVLTQLMMQKAQGSGISFMLEGGEHEYYLVVKHNNVSTHSVQTVQVLNETITVSGHGNNPAPENGTSASNVGQNQPQTQLTQGDCYCNRDFTSEEFEKIIHGLRDSETSVKKNSGYTLFGADNCKLKIDDKTLEKLRNQINSIFKKYNINTCIRKLHFLAQIYHETDRLRTTLEYATEKEYKPYFGRGLMQLTWESNYKLYKAYSGYDCVTDYHIIAEDLSYACDSAGWYWKQGKVLSVGKRWKGPSDAPAYVKVHKPDYPKNTIMWQDGKTTGKYGTVDLSIIADDDKVDLISYLVNGGANGLQERRNYVVTLKTIFEYPQKCKNKTQPSSTSNTGSTETVTIRLIRKWQTNKSTIGEFTIDNTDIKGFILEEKGPDTTISGIEQRVPIGTYNLEWHSGTKIKKGLKLYNDAVAKSRAILIHSGNTADDTEGCLLPGSTKGVDRVNGSRDKLKEIFDYVEEIGIKDAKIIITQSYE